jgi:hypothetical protein
MFQNSDTIKNPDSLYQPDLKDLIQIVPSNPI